MKIIEESSHMITVPVRDTETEDERRLILNAQQVRRGLNNLKFLLNYWKSKQFNCLFCND